MHKILAGFMPIVFVCPRNTSSVSGAIHYAILTYYFS